MRTPYYSRKFEKDVKRQQKRGKDIAKLKEVVRLLIEEPMLPVKYRDHNLTGNLVGFRECHIESDWLLIYKINDLEVYFVRTGSHSDLFE